MRFIRTVDIKFTDNLPIFAIMKSVWLLLNIVVNLFPKTWFRIREFTLWGLVFRKSPCCRLFDRSTNWRVKDSIHSTTRLVVCLCLHQTRVMFEHVSRPCPSSDVSLHISQYFLHSQSAKSVHIMISACRRGLEVTKHIVGKFSWL